MSISILEIVCSLLNPLSNVTNFTLCYSAKAKWNISNELVYKLLQYFDLHQYWRVVKIKIKTLNYHQYHFISFILADTKVNSQSVISETIKVSVLSACSINNVDTSPCLLSQ